MKAKNTFVAVHALIKKGDKYLFTKRSPKNDYMPNIWDIPGGTIEFGEELISALKREVKEEVNLKINPKKIIYAYGFVSNVNRHQFQLVYLCDYASGDVKLNSEEHSEYKWLKKAEFESLKKIAFLNNLIKEFSLELAKQVKLC